MRILALVMLSLPLGLHADDKLWEILEGGGQVVLVRHTTPALAPATRPG